MALIDRIGYDAGTTRLEDALANAANHGFHYLNFNADIGPNRLGLWADDRVRSIRQSCADHDIHLTLHTASSVNIAEFSPHVSEAVDQYLIANMELAQALACDGVVAPRKYPGLANARHDRYPLRYGCRHRFALKP